MVACRPTRRPDRAPRRRAPASLGAHRRLGLGRLRRRRRCRSPGRSARGSRTSPRRSSRAARDVRRRRAAVALGSIGRPIVIEHDLRSFGTLASGGWIASVPMMPTGKIGQPTFSASRAAPVRPLYSTPSRLRVPSGKMPNSSPRRSTASAAVERGLLLVAAGAVDRDHAHRREEVLRLPRVHVLGLADEADVARHVSIRNAESRKLMWFGHRIAGPSIGQPVEAAAVDVPQPRGDRAGRPCAPGAAPPRLRCRSPWPQT